MVAEALGLRKVTRLDVVDGPRGGVIVVRHLECGHMQWQRGGKPPSRPKTHLVCIACYLVEIGAVEG